MFFSKSVALYTVLFVLSPLAARADWAIKDVLKQAKRREKVLIQGQVKKGFDFDTFLVGDDSGDIAVSFIGVKQNLGKGDDVVVYGWFDGRASYLAKYGLLYATEWAPLSEADELKKKYAASVFTPPPSPSPESPPAPASLNVESRLKVLEDIKNKGLISTEEYQEQRKRILNDL